MPSVKRSNLPLDILIKAESFNSLINKEYSLDQKVRLIESLWRIAFIDGVLDMNEEYLVRKIADILHVPHTAFILAKNRVAPPRDISSD
jgi:uncharacterized tellurite resistance protein B-like protein